jgi:hypothetical protein
VCCTQGEERSLYTETVEAGLANTTSAGAWIGSGSTHTDEEEHGKPQDRSCEAFKTPIFPVV